MSKSNAEGRGHAEGMTPNTTASALTGHLASPPAASAAITLTAADLTTLSFTPANHGTSGTHSTGAVTADPGTQPAIAAKADEPCADDSLATVITATVPPVPDGSASALAIWALIVAIFAALISAFALAWNILSWVRAGARVTVKHVALRGSVVQFVTVVIANGGRTPITIEKVVLWGTTKGAGQFAEPTTSGLLLGSETGGPFEHGTSRRLDVQDSIRLECSFPRGDAMFSRERYRLDVKLATGRVIRTGWFPNETGSPAEI